MLHTLQPSSNPLPSPVPVYIWRSYLPLTSFPEITFCFFRVFCRSETVDEENLVQPKNFKMGWREWEKKEDGISEYDDFPSKHEKLPRSSNLVSTSDRPPHPSFLIPHHLYQGQAGRSPVLHKDFTLFCGQSSSGYLQKS